MFVSSLRSVLSQNIRKYNGKLIIKPSKNSVQSFKAKIKDTIKKNRGIPAHALIRILNPIIRGWTNYHKSICAKKTFNQLGNFLFWQLWKWAKYQHGNQNHGWIFKRYFKNNHFTDNLITKKGTAQVRLYRMAYVPIRYHVKIRGLANPYDTQYDEYFEKRRFWRTKLALECKQKTVYLVKESKTKSRVSCR